MKKHLGLLLLGLTTIFQTCAMDALLQYAANADNLHRIGDVLGGGAEWVGNIAGRAFEGTARAINNAIAERQRQINEEYERLIQTQRNILNSEFASPAEKEIARQEIERLHREQAEKRNEVTQVAISFLEKGVALADKVANLSVDEIERARRADEQRQQAVEVARVQAQEEGRAMLQRVDRILDFVKDKPYLIVGIAAGIFGSYFVLKHGTQYVADQYRIPTLAQETSLLSLRGKFKNWLLDIHPASDLKEVKMTEEMSERMSESALGLQRMVENGSILQNKLFYGPPGCGKTEYARRLARFSGMDYIYFSASAIEKFPIEQATKEISDLFTYAEAASKPLLIIADECELIFANRAAMFNANTPTSLNEKRIAINNQFLTYLSRGSDKYLVIGLTNFPDQIDEAFLSRCDEKVFFDAPDAHLRKEILDLYVDKYLVQAKHLPQDKKGFFSRLSNIFNKKKPKRVTLEENPLSEETISDIAHKFDWWTGRDIEKFIISLETAARATDTCSITPELVKKVLVRKLAEKEQLEKGSYFMGRTAAAA